MLSSVLVLSSRPHGALAIHGSLYRFLAVYHLHWVPGISL